MVVAVLMSCIANFGNDDITVGITTGLTGSVLVVMLFSIYSVLIHARRKVKAKRIQSEKTWIAERDVTAKKVSQASARFFGTDFGPIFDRSRQQLYGPWAVGRGPWAVGGGRWAVGGGRWAVRGGRWAAHLLVLVLSACSFYMPSAMMWPPPVTGTSRSPRQPSSRRVSAECRYCVCVCVLCLCLCAVCCVCVCVCVLCAVSVCCVGRVQVLCRCAVTVLTVCFDGVLTTLPPLNRGMLCDVPVCCACVLCAVPVCFSCVLTTLPPLDRVQDHALRNCVQWCIRTTKNADAAANEGVIQKFYGTHINMSAMVTDLSSLLFSFF